MCLLGMGEHTPFWIYAEIPVELCQNSPTQEVNATPFDSTSQLRPQDPTLVVRSALADAASVASLMTTTECVAWSLVAFVSPPNREGLGDAFCGRICRTHLGPMFHSSLDNYDITWVGCSYVNMTSWSTKGPKCP